MDRNQMLSFVSFMAALALIWVVALWASVELERAKACPDRGALAALK